MDKFSASSVRLSGASAAVSTTGSGSQGPTYASRRARRRQHVETNQRCNGHEGRSRVRDFVAVGLMPAQVRLLHRNLGVSDRAKQALGETEQS